jgi:anti-sigma regulatory factor (Ser/Thr protein kinase)
MAPDETASLDLTLENRVDVLTPAMDRVRDFLERHDAAPGALYAIETALEEMFTNIVKYGYDDQDQHEVQVLLGVKDAVISMAIEDDGHEFDPTVRAAPALDQSIEDIPIGGLGIHLVKQMTSRMQYIRLDGRNRLEIDVPLEGKDF